MAGQHRRWAPTRLRPWWLMFLVAVAATLGGIAAVWWFAPEVLLRGTLWLGGAVSPRGLRRTADVALTFGGLVTVAYVVVRSIRCGWTSGADQHDRDGSIGWIARLFRSVRVDDLGGRRVLGAGSRSRRGVIAAGAGLFAATVAVVLGVVAALAAGSVISTRASDEHPLLTSDWAGRAILEHFMFGNGTPWIIDNDPRWTRYMMSNRILAHTMATHMSVEVQTAFNQYWSTGRATATFGENIPAFIDNGEDIIGYQYLHGASPAIGGLEFGGITTIDKKTGGTYQITVTARYVWNKLVQKNIRYASDRTKAKVADILSLGRAGPYVMKIAWDAETVFDFNANGTMKSAQGYPY